MARRNQTGRGLGTLFVFLVLLGGCGYLLGSSPAAQEAERCEDWAESLYQTVDDSIDDSLSGSTARAGLDAWENHTGSRPDDCDSWKVEASQTKICEAWHEDVYQTAAMAGWPLRVPPEDLKETSKQVKKQLRQALDRKPMDSCSSDGWKIESAHDKARVIVDEPPTPLPTGPGSGGGSGSSGSDDDWDSPVNVGCGWSWRGGFGCGIGFG